MRCAPGTYCYTAGSSTTIRNNQPRPMVTLATSQLGSATFVLPQNSGVVPQKPYALQQTFGGHAIAFAYAKPQPPGSHSDLAPQLAMQLEPPVPEEGTVFINVRPVK